MQRNILMVIDSLRMGGAERIALTLTELFLKENIAVDIITIYDYVEYTIPENVNIYTLNYKKRYFQNTIYSYKLTNKIKSLEQEHGKPYDLVLVHLLKSSRLMKFYKHKHLYFVIHNAMSNEVMQNMSGLKRNRQLKRMQKKYNNKNLITVSQGVSEDLLSQMHIKPKSIQVIYNPIDKQQINLLANDKNVAEENLPYIIHIGRFEAQKRHDLLIDAYVKSKIEAKLLLVGDGTLKQEIESQVKRLSLEEKVIFQGRHKNPYPILKEASLLVLSSDFEGLSMVLLEALALGVRVVSRDCPSGPREILEGYLDKALVPMNDLDMFASMIQEQYTNPSKISPQILDRFNGHFVIQQYMALMEKIDD